MINKAKIETVLHPAAPGSAGIDASVWLISDGIVDAGQPIVVGRIDGMIGSSYGGAAH